MKTQISRDTHRPAKRYSGVYQQQGRMITDSSATRLPTEDTDSTSGIGFSVTASTVTVLAGCACAAEKGSQAARATAAIRA